jgi:hypothetical protein
MAQGASTPRARTRALGAQLSLGPVCYAGPHADHGMMCVVRAFVVDSLSLSPSCVRVCNSLFVCAYWDVARYTYGIFEQRIVNGEQVELPDFWLNFGNPWEIQRYDVIYDVGFGGSITSMPGGQGEIRAIWEPREYA